MLGSYTLVIASAQLPGTDSEKPPATKLEAFQARTGSVVIRGFTTVAEIRGLGAIVGVDAREFTDASDSKRITGIAIQVKETGRLERENRAFIDADEIESLLKGIEYIEKIGKNVTKLDNFEADYKTKGDLRITVFSSSKGEISASVAVGRIGRTSAFLNLSQLGELRKAVLAARALL